MSLFKKYAAQAAPTMAVVIDPVTGANVTAPGTGTDPLDAAPADDEFAEQRARRNAEHGMEATDLATPVDGEDDNLTIPGTKTEEEVAEGEHGREVVITETKDDVKVDADDSTVKHTNEVVIDDVFAEPEPEVVDEDPFDEDETEEDIETLEDEITMLHSAQDLVAQYGINPPTLGLMLTTRLLSGTAMESLGLESVQFHGPKDAESQMAIEALGEKIKEKAAAWSDKIVSTAKRCAEKIVSVMTKLWDGVSSMTTTLTGKAWDKTKAAGATIKAHPYRTVAAALAAAGAVAAIVAFSASNVPGPDVKADTLSKFFKEVADKISKIKLPFGKVKATADSGTKLLLTFDGDAAGAAKEGTAVALGWTQGSAKQTAGLMGKVFQQIKDAWNAFGVRATKLAAGSKTFMADVGDVYTAHNMATTKTTFGVMGAMNNAGRTMGHNAGATLVGVYAYYTAITLSMICLYRLTKRIVVGAFKLVGAAFRAILPHHAQAA